MRPVTLGPAVDRPQNLSEIVFERIRSAIVERTLAPGTQISEAMLGDMLNVSKTPVRSALQRLCFIGLVEPTAHRMRVVLPNKEMIRNAYELRTGLEGTAAQLAADRATVEQRATITDAAEKSLHHARAGDAAAFNEWDLAFHRMIGQSCGNSLLNNAVDNAVVLAFTLRSRDVFAPDDSVRCGDRHVALAKSIHEGYAELAGKQMIDHITEVTAFVLDSVEDPD
ncbi:GntR family transcriptional regulator [Amycolatopsis sp. NPDC001319]|uniref:GntR family transcriptional regulator n=1 Tax=unclassified Amycolatopsis TaxID=2618356 RepID=UPI0036B571BF